MRSIGWFVFFYIIVIGISSCASHWPSEVGWYYRNQQKGWTALEQVYSGTTILPELDLPAGSSELELVYVFLPGGAKRREIVEAKPSAQERYLQLKLVEVWLEYDDSPQCPPDARYIYCPIKPQLEIPLTDQSAPISRALVFKLSGLTLGAQYAVMGLEEESMLFKMPGEMVLRGVREPSITLPALPTEPGFYFLDVSYSSAWRSALGNSTLLSNPKYNGMEIGRLSEWKLNYVDDLLALAWVPDDKWRSVLRHRRFLIQDWGLRYIWVTPVIPIAPSWGYYMYLMRQQHEDNITLVDVSPAGLPALVFEPDEALEQGKTMAICTGELSFIFHKGGPQDWQSSSSSKSSMSQSPSSESSSGQAPAPGGSVGGGTATPPDKWSAINSYGLWGWRGNTLIQLLPPFGRNPAKVFYLDEVKEIVTESQLVIYHPDGFPDNFKLLHLVIRGDKIEEQRVAYSKTADGKVFVAEPSNPFLQGGYYKVTYDDNGSRVFIFRYVTKP